MTHEETTALVRRANASGFESIAEYAVSLEGDVERLRSALAGLLIYARGNQHVLGKIHKALGEAA